MQPIRIQKALSEAGVASRRAAEELVRQGRVELDGQPAAAADVKIDPAAADIRVDGEALSYSRFTYLMLHKPAGLLSATEDRRQKTVLDLLPDSPFRTAWPACPPTCASPGTGRCC